MANQRLVFVGGGHAQLFSLKRAGELASVDARSRSLGLESGRTLPYDLISFNTGSRVPAERIPGAAEHATPVKPIENLEKVRNAVLSGARRVLLLGGGPAGVELVGNLCRLAREHGLELEITLA